MTARPIKTGNQGGLAYLALLMAVAALGGGMALAGTIWHSTQQRAREEELLFVGLEYRNAIRSYYERTPGNKTYPRTLDVLLEDKRFPNVVRHLRQPYRDPLKQPQSANPAEGIEWGLVLGPDRGIMGIYSLNHGRPRKVANFPRELGWAEGKKSYADWQFVYLPPSGQAGFGVR